MFVCERCDKRYTRKSHLARHEATRACPEFFNPTYSVPLIAIPQLTACGSYRFPPRPARGTMPFLPPALLQPVRPSYPYPSLPSPCLPGCLPYPLISCLRTRQVANSNLSTGMSPVVMPNSAHASMDGRRQRLRGRAANDAHAMHAIRPRRPANPWVSRQAREERGGKANG